MSLRALKKLKEKQGKSDKIPAPVPENESSDEENNENQQKGGFAAFGYFLYKLILILEKHLKQVIMKKKIMRK